MAATGVKTTTVAEAQCVGHGPWDDAGAPADIEDVTLIIFQYGGELCVTGQSPGNLGGKEAFVLD